MRIKENREPLYDLTNAAEFLGITKLAIKGRIERGVFPEPEFRLGVYVGKKAHEKFSVQKRYWKKSTLERYREEQEKKHCSLRRGEI